MIPTGNVTELFHQDNCEKGPWRWEEITLLKGGKRKPSLMSNKLSTFPLYDMKLFFITWHIIFYSQAQTVDYSLDN